MKKILKRLTLAASAATLLLMPVAFVAAPAFAAAPTATPNSADINANLCKGANLDTNNDNCASEGDPAERVNAIISQVINIFSIIVGVVSVIMIIIGGLKYITSGGDSGNVTGAKNTILYAVVGLVIVALAQVIVRFVLSKATGTE